jgi:hypothetical protein
VIEIISQTDVHAPITKNTGLAATAMKSWVKKFSQAITAEAAVVDS